MKNLFSFDNSNNYVFKETVLRNSLRLRKNNSRFFNESVNEATKFTRCKSIRKYLMIPKSKIDLTEINNEYNKNILYSEKKNFSTNFFTNKSFAVNNKKSEEVKEKSKIKNKPIIMVNYTKKYNTYFNKYNFSNIVYKKGFSKYIKENCVEEFKSLKEEKEKEKVSTYITIKPLNRHKRNIKFLDLKDAKITKIVQTDKSLKNFPKEGSLMNSTFINTDNIQKQKNKFSLFHKYNTIFLNKINTSLTQDSLEDDHKILTNKTLYESPLITFKKKALIKSANNNQNKQRKFQESKRDTKKIFNKNFILINDSYIYNGSENEDDIINKYNTQEITNHSNFSTNICSNDTANSSKSSNNEKNEFIAAFFEDMIDLKDSFDSKTFFNYYVNDMNKKYFMSNENKRFNEANEEHFSYCYKFFCIILVIFVFMAQDDELYEKKYKMAKDIFLKYIHSSLVYTGYHNNKTKKIKLFLQNNNIYKRAKISECAINLLNIIYKDNKQYSLLYDIITQLINTFIKHSITDILSLINYSILYCINIGLKSKLYTGTNITRKNEFFFNFKDEKLEKRSEDNAPPPSIPYIKKKSRKKFSLILDLDETIVHSKKFNNGFYFFIRPGAIEFLKEISAYYEIIIFTSSYKSYADYILNKLDINKNIISYRLYKSHVIFEKGRSIKKLSMIGRDLKKIIFVDNLKSNAKYNKKNLYLIPSWIGDMKDDEIYKLKNKLIEISKNEKYSDDITKGLIDNNRDNKHNYY